MRYFFVLCLWLSFSLPGFAQSPVGEWIIDEAGWNVTFKSDGTYSVDVGMDGAIDITGTYTTENGVMTIQDDAGCTALGKYKFGMQNGQLWVDPISDGCPDRNPQQKVFFRKK